MAEAKSLIDSKSIFNKNYELRIKNQGN